MVNGIEFSGFGLLVRGSNGGSGLLGEYSRAVERRGYVRVSESGLYELTEKAERRLVEEVGPVDIYLCQKYRAAVLLLLERKEGYC